jgi:tetrahydromethanopterin S-methyltransferase subunit G
VDDELRAEFKKLNKRLDTVQGTLDDVVPVVYGLETKVETLLERVPEPVPSHREFEDLRARHERVEEKLRLRNP